MTRRLAWAWLFFLLLGAVFRLSIIDWARFTGDEAAFWSIARQIAIGENFPVFGPEITGSEARLPGASFFYFLALPQLFGPSPRLGSIFVVLLHTFAGWLFYRIVVRARGPRAGLIAMVLLCFAPWDVLYADRIWASSVAPPLGTIAIYAAFRAADAPRWQGVLLFMSLILIQVHLSVPILWVACFCLVVLRRPRKIDWRSLGLGALASFLLFLPPLIAEIGSGFKNFKAILARSGGTAQGAEVLAIPFKVLGYAIAYGSSEIGYQYERGYWGGRFDEANYYFTSTGLDKFWKLHGTILGSIILLSLLLAALAWLGNTLGLYRPILRVIKRRSLAPLSLSHILSISMWAGLAAAAVLMMSARKNYFPHYANILMPVLLWPVVAGIDSAWENNKLKPLAGLALALSVGSMAFNTYRYYRDIDGLNGLGPTLDMVGEVTKEEGSVDVRWDHFQNRYAWAKVARYYHQKPLHIQGGAPVRFQVHNYQRHQGAVPENSKLFGPVRLERREREVKTIPGLKLRAYKHWQKAQLKVFKGQEMVSTGQKAAGEIRYGAKPWQKLQPQFMKVAGKPHPLLFMHPIENQVVEAKFPVPSQTQRGELYFALTDDAVRSNNKAPVAVELFQGEDLLVESKTEDRFGLIHIPFVLSSTGAQEVRIRLKTKQEGARIFGFDLWLR